MKIFRFLMCGVGATREGGGRSRPAERSGSSEEVPAGGRNDSALSPHSPPPTRSSMKSREVFVCVVKGVARTTTGLSFRSSLIFQVSIQTKVLDPYSGLRVDPDRLHVCSGLYDDGYTTTLGSRQGKRGVRSYPYRVWDVCPPTLWVGDEVRCGCMVVGKGMCVTTVKGSAGKRVCMDTRTVVLDRERHQEVWGTHGQSRPPTDVEGTHGGSPCSCGYRRWRVSVLSKEDPPRTVGRAVRVGRPSPVLGEWTLVNNVKDPGALTGLQRGQVKRKVERPVVDEGEGSSLLVGTKVGDGTGRRVAT